VTFPRKTGPARRPVERLIPNPRLKLLDQCREVMRFKHYSYRTEQAYGEWIVRYAIRVIRGQFLWVAFSLHSLTADFTDSTSSDPCHPRNPWSNPPGS
jgi:integrase-like protein